MCCNFVLLVYLRATPEVCYQRIKKRDRKEESPIPFVSYTIFSFGSYELVMRKFISCNTDISFERHFIQQYILIK